MAIQSVTSTGRRSWRVRTLRGGPATGVWMSRSPSLTTPATSPAGRGFSRAARFSLGCGTGAGSAAGRSVRSQDRHARIASQVHARSTGRYTPGTWAAGTQVPNRPASVPDRSASRGSAGSLTDCGPRCACPRGATGGPDECCYLPAKRPRRARSHVGFGADGTAGHGELGFLVVPGPWHWARVSGERHFLALRCGQ